jgi:hypothetical protein
MTYTKTVWSDELLAGPERYNIKTDAGADIESNVQIELATGVTTAGTAVNAARLNNIEDGIERLFQAGTTPYRLSVTVASNNLTVALKNQNGDDPSASVPVRVQIGDTVREVTAALSVTAPAATNWCNAGSSELATREIDWFAYLGYNATVGVVIGFARFPYASLYSDFSATATNEKHCRISNITSAVAGDPYTLIGRFAATLSGGAGYTWSVPTYTNKNLIHRPINSTRQLEYTTTVTYSGGTTNPTSNTVSVSRYSIIDTDFRVHIQSALVRGSGDRSVHTYTLPWASFSVGTSPVNTITSISAAGLILALDFYRRSC